MVRIITVDDVKSLIRKVTFEKFILRLIDKLEDCFFHWDDFEKISRVSAYVKNGVIELMPFWGKNYYSFKYINGHPLNPRENKLTITGIGMLADIATGYPVLISEMTLLTALRTAATAALAAKYIVRSDPQVIAIIGTGAQSEFQVLAYKALFNNIAVIKYFDTDEKAMRKFAANLASSALRLEPGTCIEEIIKNTDLIVTLTASKNRTHILKNEWITPGMTINAIGGDAHGKTELDPKILARAKIVVEFLAQTQLEGEIQNTHASNIHAELWELIRGDKKGRTSADEILIFDSAGFALEDYAILCLIYSLAEDFHVGHMLDMVPVTKDPKNLFGVL